MIKRREAPDLDDQDMADLKSFFSRRSRAQLEQDLTQIQEGFGCRSS